MDGFKLYICFILTAIAFLLFVQTGAICFTVWEAYEHADAGVMIMTPSDGPPVVPNS